MIELARKGFKLIIKKVLTIPYTFKVYFGCKCAYLNLTMFKKSSLLLGFSKLALKSKDYGKFIINSFEERLFIIQPRSGIANFLLKSKQSN